MSAMSLAALSLGLPAFALVKVLAPAFFARQDTRTPVRAGVSALLANMVLNALFLALLFALWHQPSDLEEGWLQGLSKVPGLHMALAMASALASYLNLALLWRALRRDGIYQREPGWARFTLRLALACTVMVLVLLGGLWLWPDWNVGIWLRMGRLALLVGGGGASYVAVLFLMGFRVRDLRGI
jgi:putative peptidoglycan lipid II flippase